MEPPTASIPLVPGQLARQEFAVSIAGSLFPLPDGRIVYTLQEKNEADATSTLGIALKDGKAEASLGLTLPPFRRAAVRPTKTAPVIDGVLSEQGLAGLEHQTDFVTHRGTGISKFPTEFYTGLHGNNLYVAVVNHEPDMAKMQLQERSHDSAVYSDDSNELFVGRDGTEYIQLIVNSAGSRFDAKKTNSKWNGNWSSAVQRAADRWVSEWLIPLDMLGSPVLFNEELRFNLVRNNVVQGESSQWSYTNRAGNHSPQYFGTLALEKN